MVLRMIQQAALLLRAVFNSLPLEEFESEDELQAMSKKLSEENLLQLDDFIALPNSKEAIDFLLHTKAFDLNNIELLADILFTASNKVKTIAPKQAIAYQQKALLLLNYLSQETKTFDWNRIQRIQQLEQILSQ